MYGSGVKITFGANRLKKDVNAVLERKVRAVKSDPAVGYAIHSILAEMSDPYVPIDTGALRKSATPTSSYVKYDAENKDNHYHYAGYQHNLRAWEQDMFSNEWSTFVQRVAEVLTEKMNEV